MVDITPLVPAGRQIIQGYGDCGFRIAGKDWQGSVIILPDETQPWPVAAMADITRDTLSPITRVGAGIQLLLLGCGAAIANLDWAVRDDLRRNNIALEMMDTGAACRTFNVLLAEERAVAAALIAID